MDALVAQLPTIVVVIGTGIAVWRSMATRLDRIEGRIDRHLEWHAAPPVQRTEDVSERIEDLSDLSDATLEEMGAVRDAARAKTQASADRRPG